MGGGDGAGEEGGGCGDAVEDGGVGVVGDIDLVLDHSESWGSTVIPAWMGWRDVKIARRGVNSLKRGAMTIRSNNDLEALAVPR